MALESMWNETLPKSVTVVEVGPRDGLQNIDTFVPTVAKIALIDALSATGLTRIECTSFVSPKAVPQHADAEAVMRGIQRKAGVKYSALVPNERGAERALQAEVDELSAVVSVSETHNRNNVRMSVEQSLARVAMIAALTQQAGVHLRGGLATSFGCPFEGRVPPENVLRVAQTLADYGISEISLADTTGMAFPSQVSELLQRVRAALPHVRLNVHFHNTRGIGAANLIAALQTGVDSFDSSLGGLGGCPFAPGATGNICTEDMVHMLHGMHIETNIDLAKLIAAAQLAQTTVGFEMPSAVLKAGPSSRRYPPPL